MCRAIAGRSCGTRDRESGRMSGRKCFSRLRPSLAAVALAAVKANQASRVCVEQHMVNAVYDVCFAHRVLCALARIDTLFCCSWRW